MSNDWEARLEPLRRRTFLALAASFRNIKRLRWEADGSLQVEAGEGALLFFKDRKGSALVLLDGKPYFGLDNAHLYAPLPPGRHRVELRMTPYADFGQRVGANPGAPIYAERDEEGFRLWAYATTALELAEALGPGKQAEEILDVVDSALRGLFLGVTPDQIEVALFFDKRYSYLLDYLPEGFSPEAAGLRETRPDFGRALKALREGLAELRRRYGKSGVLAAFGHAHIDAAWLWNFDETRRKVERTFSTVLTLMSRRRFRFLQSSALYYEWAEEAGLLGPIKDAVGAGLWVLAGGYVEPDTNVVAGESLARHMLYSQRYFLQRFGRLAEILWLPDTFGFSAQLPQIARLAGFKIFATHKVAWNDTNRFPYNEFFWEALDGTAIPAVAFGFGKGGYNSDFTAKSVLEQARSWNGGGPILYSFGWGDGGGGPTEEMLYRAEAVDEMPILPSVQLEGPYEPKPKARWRGELYVEVHRGVYTSHSKMKRLHAEAERWLREAELWSAVAGLDFDARPLWKVVLKDQFHDVLPGSAINDVYKTVYAELEDIIARAKSQAERAAAVLAGPGGAPIAFNSLPWRRLEYVQARVAGCQEAEDGCLAPVELPPLGYAEVKPADVGDRATAVAAGGDFVLENKYLRVVVDGATGAFKSIFDKEAGREALRGEGNILVAHENIPVWDAWDVEPRFEDSGVRAALEKAEVVEAGPYRASLRLVFKFLKSTVEERVRVYAGKRRLEIVVRTSLRDRERLLKLWFHFDLNADKAVFEVPFGNVERPTTTNTSWDVARFEVPFLHWLDISEADYGVAVFSDSKHGATVRGARVGISLATTPIFPDPLADAEDNEAVVVLEPHLGDWRAASIPREAYSAIYRPFVVSGRGGSRSFGELPQDNLLLESVKRAEDGDGVVVRLYEAYNKRGTGVLRLWFKPSSVRSTDLLELGDVARELSVDGDSVRFSYRNYEIVTLKIK
ncbi:Alpha-mannosidase [Thermoproteus uzoniensis 768-20]|uniref:Alpha-mannosidase n=1 Tax=Thermoproteus uzoniensis (strain 768-20) TaxID=999630 RepID=F2L1G2_THEU7|nr:glycoside hydrolase family 38 C-terminal domain-containing protein [Thermoproteus uzoniensis]AEA11632.1 Alpha-mannosidase [Thermoproteus uzoniensis 768-20]